MKKIELFTEEGRLTEQGRDLQYKFEELIRTFTKENFQLYKTPDLEVLMYRGVSSIVLNELLGL